MNIETMMSKIRCDGFSVFFAAFSYKSREIIKNIAGMYESVKLDFPNDLVPMCLDDSDIYCKVFTINRGYCIARMDKIGEHSFKFNKLCVNLDVDDKYSELLVIWNPESNADPLDLRGNKIDFIGITNKDIPCLLYNPHTQFSDLFNIIADRDSSRLRIVADRDSSRLRIVFSRDDVLLAASSLFRNIWMKTLSDIKKLSRDIEEIDKERHDLIERKTRLENIVKTFNVDDVRSFTELTCSVYGF